MAESDNSNLIIRYIHGLIKHKGTTSNYWLKPNQIKRPYHRFIIDNLKEMWQEGSCMSPELITERLRVRSIDIPDIRESMIYQLINDAMNSDIKDHEVKEMHTVLLNRHIADEARETLLRFTTMMESPESLDLALDQLRDLKAIQPANEANLRKQLDATIEYTMKGRENLIPTGIPTLDEELGGLNRGEIEILAARSGHGKTSFSMQLLRNMCYDMGLKVLVISKEMNFERVHHKLIANVSDILTSDDLKLGGLSDEKIAEMKRVTDLIHERCEGRLWVYDDVYNSRNIETFIAKHRPDVIIDDFIQLSDMDDNNQRTEIQRILKHYKNIAKYYDCCFLVLSQLNRNIENRMDGRPRPSDLAESGSLEQLAADIIFLYYDYKLSFNEDDAERIELMLYKTRYGRQMTIDLHFDGDHMRFTEMPGVAR